MESTTSASAFSRASPVKAEQPSEQACAATRPLDLIAIGNKDPLSPSNWSGTPRQLIRTLRQHGHSVTTIGPLPLPRAPRFRLKAWLHRLATHKIYIPTRDPAVMRAWALEANARLRRLPAPDAVIAMHTSDAAYLQPAVPMVLVHDATWPQLLDFYPFYDRRRLANEIIDGGRTLDGMALNKCDLALYSSHWAADSVNRDYGIDPAKVLIHPFGPNLDAVPDAAQLAASIAKRGRGVCRLLHVGVQWERKGGDFAVAIARRLSELGLAAELQVVGCNIPGKTPPFVRCFGFLSKSKPDEAALLKRLFVEADFLVLPTRADCSPIVLNEAAANGLPAVSTAVGGIAELFAHGSWGAAFAPESGPGEYASWIAAMYRDRAGYFRMASAARQQFEQRLNWDLCAEALVGRIRNLPHCRATERRLSSQERRRAFDESIPHHDRPVTLGKAPP